LESLLPHGDVSRGTGETGGVEPNDGPVGAAREQADLRLPPRCRLQRPMLTTSTQTLFTLRIAMITHICLQQLTGCFDGGADRPPATSATGGAPSTPARKPIVCANNCNDCEAFRVTQVTEKQEPASRLEGRLTGPGCGA
ncbi:hypothetical protein ACFRFU_50970, partial [Streptomyces sp. NPDC056704]|uniref:hypothetical protein n=1 Tax=Streptomyces sp. NPDC056704 TaxID=3345917 RepID=UPI00368C0D39